MLVIFVVYLINLESNLFFILLYSCMALKILPQVFGAIVYIFFSLSPPPPPKIKQYSNLKPVFVMGKCDENRSSTLSGPCSHKACSRCPQLCKENFLLFFACHQCGSQGTVPGADLVSKAHCGFVLPLVIGRKI